MAKAGGGAGRYSGSLAGFSGGARAYAEVAARRADVNARSAAKIARAIQDAFGLRRDDDLAPMVEAVQYGTIASLRRIAGGEHPNAAYVERARSILNQLEGR